MITGVAKFIAIGAMRTLASTLIAIVSSSKVCFSIEKSEVPLDDGVCMEEIWRTQANISSQVETDGLIRI